MLYELHDMSQRAFAPLAVYAGLSAGYFDAFSFMPAPVRHCVEANLRMFERLSKTYRKPEFGIHTTQTPAGTVGVEESVVLTKPFCQLRHFAKSSGEQGPRLLIVAPLSGHHATLLRGTVEALLPLHDVYITDWADACEVPLYEGAFDLSDYVRYMQEFMQFLGPDSHVLAVCQPCVPVLAAVSLMEQNNDPVVPRTMTLIAGPLDTRRSLTEVDRFATDHDLSFFRANVIERVPLGHAGAFRSVYPGFLQLTGFVLMNRSKHFQAYADYHLARIDGDEAAAAKHEAFYDEYNAVLDMPAEYYLETIQKVFLEPQLALGKLELCGQLVQPEAIRRVALLTIEGSRDDITGEGQTHIAHEMCAALPQAKRAKCTIEGVGHYGAFSGSRFEAQALPVINAFIASNSAEGRKAKTAANPA